MSPLDITGVVLAGGQSRRMFPDHPGGGDKSLRDLAGRPMLAHVLDRFSPQVARVVLNANGDPARFARFSLPVTPDSVGGYVGPLAGVLAGMEWCIVHAPQSTHIATVSADAPFIPPNLVARFVEGCRDYPASIAIARSTGELHPVIGLWPVSHARDLRDSLLAGVRKVLAWTDRHGTVAVDFPFAQIAGSEIDPFFNANHPEELAEASRLLGG